jgi:hypothetical protein
MLGAAGAWLVCGRVRQAQQAAPCNISPLSHTWFESNKHKGTLSTQLKWCTSVSDELLFFHLGVFNSYRRHSFTACSSSYDEAVDVQQNDG